MFRKYKKRILFSIALGAAVFLGFSIYADFDKLMKTFSEFNWYYLPLILLLTYLNFVIRFYKWEYYLGQLKISLKKKASFLIFMSTFVMSVTPGKMGELLKSYLLREENSTPVSISAPIIIAERLTDFISIVILCIAGAFVFNFGQNIIIGVGLFFILFVILISSRKISLRIISYLEKIKFLYKIAHKFRDSYESIYTLVRIKPLLITTLMSVVAWFCECLGLYIILKVYSSFTHIDVNLLAAVFIYGFSTIVGSISMLPGGLGVTEASMTGLLVLLKIPKDVSVASTFIIRVSTLWFAVLVGVISVYFYQKYSNKNLENIGVNQAET